MPGGLHRAPALLGDQHVEVKVHVLAEDVPGDLEDPGVEDRLRDRDGEVEGGPHHLVTGQRVSLSLGSPPDRYSLSWPPSSGRETRGRACGCRH